MSNLLKETPEVLSDETKNTIIIVGVGYGGARFFSESINRVICAGFSDSVRYILVDKREVSNFGTGVAWNLDQIDALRANMHSTAIVLDAQGNKALLDRLQFEAVPKSELRVGQLFESRTNIGNLLHQDFCESLEKAMLNDVEVHLVKGRASTVERRGAAKILTLSDGRSFAGRAIVLALGHFPPTQYKHLHGCPGYIGNPWKWAELDAVDHTAPVALIGLGPTAVDAMLVLRTNGIGRVDGYSRSGRLQYPRPKPVNPLEMKITESCLESMAAAMGGLTVESVFGLGFTEYSTRNANWRGLWVALKNSSLEPSQALREGLRKSNIEADWFTILMQLDDLAPLAWHLLRDDQRAEFKRWHKIISPVAYGMAPPQALRVLNEIDHGRFRVRGGLDTVVYHERDNIFKISYHIGDEKFEENYKYIVDCSGFGVDPTVSDWPIVNKLLEVGLGIPHPWGGLHSDFETGQLEDKVGEKTSEIYCLAGSLTIGKRLITNGLIPVAKSAERTAKAIHKKLELTLYSSTN